MTSGLKRTVRLKHAVSTATLVFMGAMTFAGRSEADAPTPEQREFFEKKVRPVLAENCFSCHAGKNAMSGLRLDSREALLKGGERGSALVAGQPEKSLMLTALGYHDPKLQMPPQGKLSDEKIAALTEWVKMGAPWPDAGKSLPVAPPKSRFNLQERAKHWSFQPVRRPVVPKPRNSAWGKNPIDAFLLAKLEASGLKPAPPADKRTLLRRLYFDLIGLPPTPQEVDSFLADKSPNAYEKVVNRLLASPHYGERWARHWLDLVRYAETDGHEFDFDKPGAYEYRDYVIRALNADVPYDQFVKEHIAGDLLPKPRRNPTAGFNESILGTGFFFLGEGTHSPVDLQEDEAGHIDNQIDVLSKTFLGLSVGCARCHDHKFDPISTKDYYALSGFLKSSRYEVTDLTPPERLRPTLNALEPIRAALEASVSQETRRPARTPKFALAPGQTLYTDFSGTDWGGWTTTGAAFGDRPRPVSLALQFRGWEPQFVRLAEAGAADSGYLSDRLQGTLRSPTFLLTKPYIFYHLAGKDTEVNLIIDNFQRIRDPIYGGLKIGLGKLDRLQWHRQDVRKWLGHPAYIEFLDRGNGRLIADGVVFSDTDKAPGDGNVSDGLRTASFSLAAKTRPEALALWERRQKLEAALPAPRWAMAMADGTGENDRVHLRGSVKTLGDVVPRRFLEACGGLRTALPATGSGRLELARRLVAASDPLLARVMVNRLWQHHFGEGIVRSPDDFGIMGQAPTHPELLDWLASEFVRQGWSLKKMHRLILLSSAYRMASQADPKAEQRDPTNRLWHKMPIRRLEAEAIRDAILTVSGRLDSTLYGPSVPPYLTSFMEGRGRPDVSGPLDGAGRRSLYIGVRRNFLTPMFLAFDFPVPFSTMGRRTVSSVPAQALTLMNDPFVVEQARVWTKRVLAEPNRTPEARIRAMYLTAFSRLPDASELAATRAFLREQGQQYGGENDPRAWQDLCHTLFNVKEFIFIR